MCNIDIASNIELIKPRHISHLEKETSQSSNNLHRPFSHAKMITRYIVERVFLLVRSILLNGVLKNQPSISFD